jgi:hypothetical protein
MRIRLINIELSTTVDTSTPRDRVEIILKQVAS